MIKPLRIAVLVGGLSPERNISLLSGKAAVSALQHLGHDVVAIDPALGSSCVMDIRDLETATASPVPLEELTAMNPQRLYECVNSGALDNIDIAFLCLHGKYGEDGYIQSLLDLRGIPYTGSQMLASAMAMDKAVSKLMFQVAGIPTAAWVSVTTELANDYEALKAVFEEIPRDVVVKPNDQGSTVGLTIVSKGDTQGLSTAILQAAKFSNQILVEQYIPGRELTVAVLGAEALPVIEIEPQDGFYDYANKYTKGTTLYHCPADVSEEVRDHVMNLAVTAHQVMGCRGYSRVDFRLSPDNYPYCLEINTLPGFTASSLFPMAAKQCGIEFPQLCQEILNYSLLQ
jgi:D-alanine-D-alanine ligase